MRFSVGYELTEQVRAAILQIPEDAWVPALDQDGSARNNGEVCEITDMVDLSAWPEGSRLIVRRERPHPGAQLSFTDHDGYRFQAILTDQPDENIAVLECRHRQHAHVEDRIRDDKDTGLAKFPFKEFALNEVWLEIVMLAHDLIVWTQALVLDGELAKAEPKRLRYRLLHVAGRLAFSGRRAQAPPPGHMALGHRAPRRVPEAQNARGRDRLTTAASRPHHHPADPPATGRDHRCPETGPAHRQRSRRNALKDNADPARSPTNTATNRQTATRSHSHAPTARSGLGAASCEHLSSEC